MNDETRAGAGASEPRTSEGVVQVPPDSLYARWERVRGTERTVIGLTAVFVALFPYVFARMPIVSDVLQGYQSLASLILIWGIFAIGFDLLLGYTGLLSFGHAAFWGAAAYAAAVFSTLHGTTPLPELVSTSPILMVLVAMTVAVLFAWVLGFLSLRRGGIYFAILTLAFAQMLFYLAARPLQSITGGDNGFTNVDLGLLFGTFDLGSPLPFPVNLLMGDWLYVFVGACTVLAVAAAYRILNSPYGMVFRAIRENEQRTEFVGLNVWRYKLMSFILSGAFAGVAGGLYVVHSTYVPLESLYWTTSGEVVIMTVLGGGASLFGPLLGAGVYLYLENIVAGMAEIGDYWHLILGLTFVTVIWFFPRGIWGGITDVRRGVGSVLRQYTLLELLQLLRQRAVDKLLGGDR